MAGVMTMSLTQVAREAKVVVFAVLAGDEVGVIIDGDARVAGAAGLGLERNKFFLVGGESTWNLVDDLVCKLRQ